MVGERRSPSTVLRITSTLSGGVVPLALNGLISTFILHLSSESDKNNITLRRDSQVYYSRPAVGNIQDCYWWYENRFMIDWYQPFTRQIKPTTISSTNWKRPTGDLIKQTIVFVGRYVRNVICSWLYHTCVQQDITVHAWVAFWAWIPVIGVFIGCWMVKAAKLFNQHCTQLICNTYIFTFTCLYLPITTDTRILGIELIVCPLPKG